MTKAEKDEFFKDVELETHNINLCLGLCFDEQSSITRIDYYKDALITSTYSRSGLIAVLDRLQLSVSGAARANFLAQTEKLLKDLEEKHKNLVLQHPVVKVVLIYDAKDFTIKNWTSLPTLGGNADQVRDYFDGILRFSKMTLAPEEQESLETNINKMMDKMLGTN